MPDSLLALVQATRDDVAAMRRELGELRGEVATRRELEQHRADDRRELDGLGRRVDRLAGRERWLAGGLSVLGVMVLAVVVPLLAAWIGR